MHIMPPRFLAGVWCALLLFKLSSACWNLLGVIPRWSVCFGFRARCFRHHCCMRPLRCRRGGLGRLGGIRKWFQRVSAWECRCGCSSRTSWLVVQHACVDMWSVNGGGRAERVHSFATMVLAVAAAACTHTRDARRRGLTHSRSRCLGAGGRRAPRRWSASGLNAASRGQPGGGCWRRGRRSRARWRR